MKITAEPRSDQINAEDFLSGPKTYTIAGIREGTAEQKYDIALEGEKRVWRPPPTVLRTLMKAWESDDSADWIGKRVTLYCDESVSFGRERVGGIRVSHVSGIEKPVTVSVTATRGKRTKVTVQPLPDAPEATQQPTGEIPADVVSNVERAKQDGNLGAYLAYLEDHGAPDAIKAYVRDQMEPEA